MAETQTKRAQRSQGGANSVQEFDPEALLTDEVDPTKGVLISQPQATGAQDQTDIEFWDWSAMGVELECTVKTAFLIPDPKSQSGFRVGYLCTDAGGFAWKFSERKDLEVLRACRQECRVSIIPVRKRSAGNFDKIDFEVRLLARGTGQKFKDLLNQQFSQMQRNGGPF